jgi:hypothetical protein
MIRTLQGNPDFENFDEAYQLAYRVFQHTVVPSSIKSLLNDPAVGSKVFSLLILLF